MTQVVAITDCGPASTTAVKEMHR